MIEFLGKFKKFKWSNTKNKLTLQDYQYHFNEFCMKQKYVFILGAGFSYDAGVPTQASLLSKIIKHENTFEPKFETNKINIIDFIKNIFPNIEDIDVEEVFTILDRAVNEKEKFRTYTWQKLDKLRARLVYLILFVIDESLKKVDYKTDDAYKTFTKYLIKLRKTAYSDLTIVSTNWDNLLEKYIEAYMFDKPNIKTDYCIYTYKLNDKTHIPDILRKSKGFDNIKILKLHGSINWLYCSNCKRIYIDDLSIAIQQKKCEYCTSNDLEESDLYIEPMIITPTLLKEYHNLYIQGIWQNAFIELQEAKKVYFIGYSLPKIDFELKYLLKKSIQNLDITVVLAPDDEGKETHKNYQRLFGNEKVTYCFDGFEKWINNFEDA